MQRIRLLHLIFGIFFLLLVFCLFYLQIIKGPLYKDLSYKNSIRLLSIPAARGAIYDRNSDIIADSALSFGVFIVPQEVKDLDAEIEMLSKILDVSPSHLKRNYRRNYRAPFAPCKLIENIPKTEAIIIEELKLDMPGVLVTQTPLRRYPYKDAFAHIIGYLGEIDRDELDLLKSYGYSARDLLGKAGVEKLSDSFLRGIDGGMQIQVDNRGRQVKILNFKEPKKGKDVYLTLDSRLQVFLWKMMKGKTGAAVFLDPKNGEVVSLLSTPSYDPNTSLTEILYSPDAPLINRAIMGQYPPGSLFKIVVALGGLDSGTIDAGSRFFCQGKLGVGIDEFRCWKGDGHGSMDLKRAITQSCNVYFYNLGISLGVEKISQYAHQFGFGRHTGIELQGEEPGFVPSRFWKRSKKGQSWYAGDTANLSIGQGYLLATPLQIARMVAAVANGGELIQPHILKKIGDTKILPHRKTELKLEPQHIELVKSAMRGVVEDLEGTGFRAYSSLCSISGKTGSSQAGENFRTHAWFAGFAPSENPEICFVIFLEHGGSGGDMPALIARKAVEYWYRNR